MGGVERGDGLAGLLLDLAPQLGEPLLAQAGELGHGEELLLDGEQVGLHVAAQLHQVGLLRGEGLLQGQRELAQRVDLGRALGVGAGALRLQRRDLELDFSDVAFQGAARDEPQGHDEGERPRHAELGAYGCFRASPPATMSN